MLCTQDLLFGFSVLGLATLLRAGFSRISFETAPGKLDCAVPSLFVVATIAVLASPAQKEKRLRKEGKT